MSIVNLDYILNGTDQKVLNLKYEEMKKDYNETTAESYFNTYKGKPLSFIFENSRKIFSEPIFGLDYYKEAVFNSCAFMALDDELEKVSNYIEENANLMSNEQKDLYDNLKDEMTNFVESHRNTIIAATAFNDRVRGVLFAEDGDLENSDVSIFKKYDEAVSNAVFADDMDFLNSLIKETPDDLISSATLIYAPYICEKCGPSAVIGFQDRLIELNETTEDDEKFADMIDKIIYANKLSCDSGYVESCKSLNRDFRELISFYENASLKDYLIEATSRKEQVVYHESPEDMIRSIFDDMDEDDIYREEYLRESAEINEMIAYAYESTFKMLEAEAMYITDVTKPAIGYTIESGTSYEQLMDTAIYMMDSDTFEEDTEDDEIDSLDDSKDDDKSKSDEKSKDESPKK